MGWLGFALVVIGVAALRKSVNFTEVAGGYWIAGSLLIFAGGIVLGIAIALHFKQTI